MFPFILLGQLTNYTFALDYKGSSKNVQCYVLNIIPLHCIEVVVFFFIGIITRRKRDRNKVYFSNGLFSMKQQRDATQSPLNPLTNNFPSLNI